LATWAEQISLLKDANIQYRKETTNLTKALKGDSNARKLGELIWSAVLEKFIRKDRIFFTKKRTKTILPFSQMW
jgi:DNA recombination protein RmuC